MIDKEKANRNMTRQWVKFGIVMVLYLLFLIWLKSWLGLIVVPFIFDAYITKKIRWQWWKDSEGPVRFIMGMVTEPVVTVLPTEEPETMPQRAEEMTATLAGPPAEAPATELAGSMKKLEMHVRA